MSDTTQSRVAAGSPEGSRHAQGDGRVEGSRRAPSKIDPVLVVRVTIVIAVLAAWEALAASGWLYKDVVPSLLRIAEALWGVVSSPAFYSNLAVTALEVGVGLVIGGSAGLVAGLVLGGSRFLARAYEPFLYWLAPTPKIIFFPVMIMLFGVGWQSKSAMAVISCFFPIALSVAAGMRGIDRVLIRVGRSFRANLMQMVTKVYLPAMRAPIINGVRLGFGVAVIGTLLAETKLSNQGLGFMVIQAYSLFNMPMMYALLILVFAIAITMNSALAWLAGGEASPGR
jgi:ABC-type nitrate/sulfonate/bicarbonate transport system permease component